MVYCNFCRLKRRDRKARLHQKKKKGKKKRKTSNLEFKIQSFQV